MNIAILVDTLAVGGAERQAILCVSELRNRGHRADLVYYHPQVEYSEMLEQLRLAPIYVAGDGFGQRCRRMSSLLKAGRYDVVHGFKMAGEVYAAIAGVRARVPRRFGCFRNIYNLGPKYRLLHFGIDKFLHAWIVNSEAAADSMSRLAWIPRSKFHVVRNGVSTLLVQRSLTAAEAKSKLGFSGDAVLVTMVARLEPQKNIPMLLESTVKVAAKAPKVHFLLVGKGSQEHELRRRVSALGLNGTVSFLGQRSDIDLILAATDISVLTSNHEGLPNVIIEAMTAGKPIACTDYAGAREIMVHEQNSLLSPCGDPQAFAENVLRLVRDPFLRRSLGEEAMNYSKREFSPSAMARRLEAVYLHYGSAGRQGSTAVSGCPLAGASTSEH